MKIFNVILGPLNILMRYLAMSTFTMMVICVFSQVLFRYVFNISAPWTEELARFTFIWATFLGAGIAFAEGGHLGVQVVVNRFKTPRGNAFIRLVADFFCFWLLGVYVVEGTDLSLRLIEMGQTSPAIPSLLIGFVYLAIPLGSFLMIVNILPKSLSRLQALVTGKWATTGQGEEQPDLDTGAN